MPSSVRRLFAAVDLEPEGCVPWRSPLPEKRSGIYVVSLTSNARSVSGGLPRCPVNKAALDEFLRICPALTLDGNRPTRSRLGSRLGAYWLPDETVLYIGLAGTSLRERVRSYYVTPLGASKPHKGGWWLKTLANLDRLYVHYAASENVKNDETRCSEPSRHACRGARAERSRRASLSCRSPTCATATTGAEVTASKARRRTRARREARLRDGLPSS